MNKLLIEKVIQNDDIRGYVVTDMETQKDIFQSLTLDKCLEYIKRVMED